MKPPRLAPFILAAGIGCSDNATTPNAVPTPQATSFAIAGAVTSKIDNGPIEGSRLDLRGIDGPGAGSNVPALVNNGSYFIDKIQAGTYEFKITGDNHVEHVTEQVVVAPGRTNMPFSLFVYGDEMFGISYDKRFHEFFNIVQRIDEYYKTDHIRKWNRLPSEIYVVKDGMSEEAFQRVMGYARNFIDNSIEKLACSDSLNGMPVNFGPETTSAGKFVVRLKDIDADYLATAGLYMADNSTINGCDVNLSRALYENNIYEQKYEQMAVDHELSHCFGMNHAYQTDVPSIMNNSLTVTDHDHFARCLAERTQKGNRYPDTDRSYDVASSRQSHSYSEVCRLPVN